MPLLDNKGHPCYSNRATIQDFATEVIIQYMEKIEPDVVSHNIRQMHTPYILSSSFGKPKGKSFPNIIADKALLPLRISSLQNFIRYSYYSSITNNRGRYVSKIIPLLCRFCNSCPRALSGVGNVHRVTSPWLGRRPTPAATTPTRAHVLLRLIRRGGASTIRTSSSLHLRRMDSSSGAGDSFGGAKSDNRDMLGGHLSLFGFRHSHRGLLRGGLLANQGSGSHRSCHSRFAMESARKHQPEIPPIRTEQG